MDRLACIDLPAFPLQLTLIERPEWRDAAVAIVDRDAPNGRIEWVNETARQLGILPGLRYAAALSLVRGTASASDPAKPALSASSAVLHASVVRQEQIDAAHAELLRLLQRFSPRVEAGLSRAGSSGSESSGSGSSGSGSSGSASMAPSGTFWLDATGLTGAGQLYRSLEHWGDLIRAALHHRRLEARMVIGFDRFASWIVARGGDIERETEAPDSASRDSPSRDSASRDSASRDSASRDSASRDSASRDSGFAPFGLRIFSSPQEEAAHAHLVPLERLDEPARRPGKRGARASPGGFGLDAKTRRTLLQLGIRTVGDLAKLPAESLHRRFDARLCRLHELARGQRHEPLVAEPIILPLEGSDLLEHPEEDLARLTLAIGRLLHGLLEELARREEALRELTLEMRLDDGSQQVERLRPAAPTRDLSQLSGLLFLRLTARSPRAAVTELHLRAEGARQPIEQLELFRDLPGAGARGERPGGGSGRDLRAAERALARVRAELGEAAVVRARPREGHLPEARFVWEILPEGTLTASSPGSTSSPEARSPEAPSAGFHPGVLVRRFYERAWRLPPRPRHEPDGWLLRGIVDSPVERVVGPYLVTGGWWRLAEDRPAIHREYHFARTRRGEILWIYYDRPRRRWFLQGRVE